ncbi:MAG: hypothetical protein QNJ71_08865 [Acidimicrobiia bacterium]|nr:hypothetical protein [Acidimicrobiia bacterium]
MRYRHVQWGWTWLLYLIFAIVLVAVSAAGSAASDEDEGWVIALVLVFLAILQIVLVFFSRLQVTVDDDQVVASFGWGWPSRSIPLAEIVSARSVRNHWYHGWGIRRIPDGWMYNVWGLDAVELQLGDESAFRIGTNDADRLEAAVALSIPR